MLLITSIAILCVVVHGNEIIAGNVRTRQLNENNNKKSLRMELHELLGEQQHSVQEVAPTELQLPHDNGQCQYAVPLGNSMSTSGSISPTVSQSFGSCYGASAAKSGSAWYSVRADSWSQMVEVYNANFPAQISIFTGSCSSLSCYAASGSATAEFNASPGDTFYVAVHSTCSGGDPVPYGSTACSGSFEIYFRSM